MRVDGVGFKNTGLPPLNRADLQFSLETQHLRSNPTTYINGTGSPPCALHQAEKHLNTPRPLPVLGQSLEPKANTHQIAAMATSRQVGCS